MGFPTLTELSVSTLTFTWELAVARWMRRNYSNERNLRQIMTASLILIPGWSLFSVPIRYPLNVLTATQTEARGKKTIFRPKQERSVKETMTLLRHSPNYANQRQKAKLINLLR